MARSALRNRFTVYDMMEAKGAFTSNPANSDSTDPTEGTSLYLGPVKFPMMFYHPEAKRRVLNPGEALRDGQGNPILDREGHEIIRGLQTEIIWEIASSEADEKRLRAEGWWDHPAKALLAAGEEAPATGAGQRIEDLEAQLAELQKQIAAARPAEATAGVIRKREAATPLAAE